MPPADEEFQLGRRRRVVAAIVLLLIANAVAQLLVADFDSGILVYADLIQATVDWDAAQQSGVLLSYHSRRFLVPRLLHFTLRATVGEFGVNEAVLAHQLFGLVCSLAMVWLWHRIALHERLSPAALMTGAILLTSSSVVAKTAYYFPAEPYPLKLAIGLALLWAYLARSQWGAFVAALIGLFVFDVFFVFASLMIVFPRSTTTENYTFRGERSLPLLFAAAFAAVAIFLRLVLDLDPDYPPTDHGPRWFIPISIAAGTTYYYFLARCLTAQWGVPSLPSLFRAASPRGVVLVVLGGALGSLIGGHLTSGELEVMYPADNWLPPPLDFMQPGPATHLTFWLGRNGFIPRSVALPLISYGSAVVNWSAAFPAVILLWPRLTAAARRYGWGVCLQLCLGVLMMFDSEGRHQVLQIPLLVFLAVGVLDRAHTKVWQWALLAVCAVVGSGAWLTFGESAVELLRGGWRADLFNWGFGAAASWRNFWRGLPFLVGFTWLVWFAVRAVYRTDDPGLRPHRGLGLDLTLVGCGALALSVVMLVGMTHERRWRWQSAIYETRYLRTIARLLAINAAEWHSTPPGPDYYCDSPGSQPGKVANYIRMAARPGQSNLVSSPTLSLDRDSAYRVTLTARSRFPRPILVSVVAADRPISFGDLRRIDLRQEWTRYEFRVRAPFQGPARLQFDLGPDELEYEYEDLRCEPIELPAWTLSSSNAAALVDNVGDFQSRLVYGAKTDDDGRLELSTLLPVVEPGRYELQLRMRAEGPCMVALGVATGDDPAVWLRPPATVAFDSSWTNYSLELEVSAGVEPRLSLVPQSPYSTLELDAPRWRKVAADP